jgi:hypothetical protein
MSHVLERGGILFFYRPRVDVEEVDAFEDVQRFFIVLRPVGTRRFRRIVIGRKRLPDPEAHERVWGLVVEVADDPGELLEELERKAYETKTRGTRELPEARSAGEGRYSIVDHDGHTHLAYALELPREPGEVQHAFGIEPEASYIVALKNPHADPRTRGEFPDELVHRFGGRRFISVNPPSLLDYEGIELVLIGAARDAEAELGIDLDADLERAETADILEDLRVREPVEEGTWR